MSTIALLTDFGLDDWYVGVMKGVALRINPSASLVDVTHAVAPGNVREGAFVLMNSFSWFPEGAVFCVVVDPGVGSERKIVVAQTSQYSFVAPDNGVLSFVLDKYPDSRIYSFDNRHYALPQTSATFHGRDIFAPAAAHLSRGIPPEMMGAVQTGYVRLERYSPVCTRSGVEGTIEYIDRFGNAITSIEPGHIDTLEKDSLPVVNAGKGNAIPLCRWYRQVPAGAPLALIGSSGFLEVSINGGNAADRLELKVGDRVTVQ
ncbi:MAG: hypothetical protein GF401_17180 [Chitinivibrionales bacterium]|nr:hypothetical protein [Chitinivibrionales bacterium]